MKKRILALVLSVAMVLGAVSFTAFADTPANPYASGKNDTATYLMKVPADTAGLAGMYNVTDDAQLTVRQENGENFIVFDESLFGEKAILASVNTPKLTYGVDKGVPAEIDLTKLNDTTDIMYFAIRFKVNDNAPAYSDVPANFNINLTFNDPDPAIEPEYQNFIVTPTKFVNKATPFQWLSLKDGSITSFHSQGGVGDDGIGIKGNADGWILIPACLNKSGVPYITPEYLRNLFTGLQFDFSHNDMTASGVALARKDTNWDNKEVLIGDVMLVSDKTAFAKARSEKYGVAGKMYAPNNGEDTAYMAARIGEMRYNYYGYNGAKGTGIGRNSSNTGLPSNSNRAYLHIVTLPNGDKAAQGLVNEGYETKEGKNVIKVSAIDTYENSLDNINTANNCQYDGVPGLPTEYIDLAKINYLSFRVATKGIADGESAVINYALLPKGASASSMIPAGTVVKFIDAATGAKTEYTTGDNGITLTKDVDGWFLVEKSAFACMANEDIATTWGNGGYTGYGIQLILHSGFGVGEGAYMGDTYFVEDAVKFQQFHCTHANKTVGAVVAPTCQEKGYTPVTCPDCGLVEKTLETDIIAHDKNVDVPGQAATCKEPGFSAAKKCSMCGEITEMSSTIAPIAHDKNVDVPEVPATCQKEGVAAGKKCSMCNEVQEGCTVIAKIAHDKLGGDVAGKAATCKEAGVEAAKKCSMCGEISEGGAVIAPIAHDKNVDVAEVPATCKTAGTTAGKKCSMCGEVQEGCTAIAPIAHDKAVDVAAVDATCTTKGATAGKKCSMCGEVQEGCEEIAMLAHDLEKVETVAPTATEKGYDVLDCKNCDYTEKNNYVDALGNGDVDDDDENKGNEEDDENKSPNTGDNNLFVMIMMIVALGAATVLFTTKKRANR